MITIQIDENKYKQIIKNTYDNLGFTLSADCEAWETGFEQLTDFIDNSIEKGKK
jgi:hypothetical protein